MKRTILTGAVILGSLMSFNVTAQQNMSPEEQAAVATDNRQAVFKLLQVSMAPLGNMARGQAYDEEAAISSLERIITLAPMITELFETDTTGFDMDTRALDSIWQNKATFNQLAADLETSANEALEMVRSQGEGAVRRAVGTVGPKCGACHDMYRLD